MLSLQPPRCRFSLPIAFSGSGDPRSLSWPGPSQRIGCSSAPNRRCGSRGLRRKAARVRSVGKEEAELRTSSVVEEEEGEEKRGEYEDVDPQDLEYVRQIRRVSSSLSWFLCAFGYRCGFPLSRAADRIALSGLCLQVLELLKKNRDMIFSEVIAFLPAGFCLVWCSFLVACFTLVPNGVEFCSNLCNFMVLCRSS